MFVRFEGSRVLNPGAQLYNSQNAKEQESLQPLPVSQPLQNPPGSGGKQVKFYAILSIFGNNTLSR